jgi:Kef-type K+ transport system membrane component KefB
MSFLLVVLIILFIVFILERLCLLLGLPKTFALLFSSVLFGMSFLQAIVSLEQTNFIFILGNIGLVVLLFFSGLETSWDTLFKEKNDSFFLGLFGWIIPFILAFLISLTLGFSSLQSFIIGICLSMSAEATKAGVLVELDKMKTRLASALMGSSIIDDILGLLAFILVLLLSNQAILSENTLISFSVLAFFLGVYVNKNNWITKKNLFNFKEAIFLALVPFFFVSTGLNISLSGFSFSPMLFFSLLIVAIFGKILGALLSKRFVNFSYKQLLLIGWGMNSRGAIELAISFVMYSAGIISLSLYSILVIISLLTTFLFPLIFSYIVHKNPHITD